MSKTINTLSNNENYYFFDCTENFKIKLEKLYEEPYLFKIKLSNCDDYNFIEFETNKVLTINELPQNIIELVNKYDLIKKYINCYSNEFYLHFNITFIGNNDAFEQFFVINVDILKKMIIKK